MFNTKSNIILLKYVEFFCRQNCISKKKKPNLKNILKKKELKNVIG